MPITLSIVDSACNKDIELTVTADIHLNYPTLLAHG
jgi:hypothetical protein